MGIIGLYTPLRTPSLKDPIKFPASHKIRKEELEASRQGSVRGDSTKKCAVKQTVCFCLLVSRLFQPSPQQKWLNQNLLKQAQSAWLLLWPFGAPHSQPPFELERAPPSQDKDVRGFPDARLRPWWPCQLAEASTFSPQRGSLGLGFVKAEPPQQSPRPESPMPLNQGYVRISEALIFSQKSWARVF